MVCGMRVACHMPPTQPKTLTADTPACAGAIAGFQPPRPPGTVNFSDNGGRGSGQREPRNPANNNGAHMGRPLRISAGKIFRARQ
jgi:hypothetical protein